MRRVLAAAAILFASLLLAAPASAHPLGNFTVNQYSGIVLRPGAVAVDYVLDMAEIPAFQTLQRIGTNTRRYRSEECAALARGVALRVDGRALRPRVASSEIAFPPGAGGLSTLRLSCRFEAPAPRGEHRLDYSDANFSGRVGWREITASGDGTRLDRSTVPRTSVSARLTSYPQDLLQSPLDVRRARVRFVPAAAAANPAPSGAATAAIPARVDRASRAFTSLVARRELTPAFAVLALAIALALGALHALAPGHGKTVMAAYLVGVRGRPSQALVIGATVTATHTAGVMALGAVLAATSAIAPERLYPWLGLTSGLLVIAIGAGLLRRALGQRGRHHRHDPPPMRSRNLVALGFAGGITPSPTALVVLLAAIAVGRAWFGLVLVVAYGLGMAATLTGAGLLLVRARSLIDRRRSRGFTRVGRALPLATSSLVVAAGALLAARAAAALV